MEENQTDPKASETHARDHFEEALKTLQDTHGDRVTKKDEERVLGIAEAVRLGDKVKAEEHLIATKVESSWLYEELMKHPMISQMLREISIFGL